MEHKVRALTLKPRDSRLDFLKLFYSFYFILLLLSYNTFGSYLDAAWRLVDGADFRSQLKIAQHVKDCSGRANLTKSFPSVV